MSMAQFSWTSQKAQEISSWVAVVLVQAISTISIHSHAFPDFVFTSPSAHTHTYLVANV